MRKEQAEGLPDGEDSFGILAEQYRPLILSMSAKYAGPGLEEEDLRQEALIALYLAAETYRDDLNVTFGLYAKICIRNRMVSLIRKQKRTVNEDLLPSDGETDPEQRLLDSEARAALLESIGKLLSPLEKKVLALYLGNRSYSEIARALDMSEKAVDNAIYRLKAKLKKHI